MIYASLRCLVGMIRAGRLGLSFSLLQTTIMSAAASATQSCVSNIEVAFVFGLCRRPQGFSNLC